MGLKLKNDIIFKAVFGRENEKSKEALIGMLNLILDRKDDPIRRITYKNPFNLRDFNVQKESILDIKAETDHAELADIEMQMLYDNEIVPRNIYYHGGMITESLAAGEHYGKLKRTISIYILDHILFQDDDSYHKCFQLRERTDGRLLTELVEIHYIELPKVNPGKKKSPKELSDVEKFLEFLRYAGDAEDDDYLKSLKGCGGKEIQMTETIMREVTEEERLREQAIARDKFLHRQASIERQLKEAKEVLAQRDAYQRESEKYQRESEKYQRQIIEHERQIEDFKLQTEAMHQQVEDNRREMEESRRKVEESHREMEESRRKVEESRREMEESHREMEESRREMEESRRKVEESRRENQQLKQIINAMIEKGVEKSELAQAVSITEEELEQYIK